MASDPTSDGCYCGGVIGEEGTRAQHKRRTRERIVQVATRLFLERGFAGVSVADIAAAAEVSKMTVFNYFDTKEDILLSQLADQVDDAATAVRTRAADESPLTALRRRFVTKIGEQDPATGICIGDEVIAFRTLILNTRSLTARLIEQTVQAEQSLAAALQELPAADPLLARVVAAQVIGAERALMAANFDRVRSGASIDDLTALGARDAERTYDLLADGLTDTVFGQSR